MRCNLSRSLCILSIFLAAKSYSLNVNPTHNDTEYSNTQIDDKGATHCSPNISSVAAKTHKNTVSNPDALSLNKDDPTPTNAAPADEFSRETIIHSCLNYSAKKQASHSDITTNRRDKNIVYRTKNVSAEKRCISPGAAYHL